MAHKRKERKKAMLDSEGIHSDAAHRKSMRCGYCMIDILSCV